jgi:hypothetical protein
MRPFCIGCPQVYFFNIGTRAKSVKSAGPALDSLIDVKASRDVVVRSYAVYK